MEQYAQEIIGFVLVCFVGWLARETHANGQTLAEIKVRLFGDAREQEGGIVGEVKLVRERTHGLANEVHAHGLRLDNIESRVTRLEVEDE